MDNNTIGEKSSIVGQLENLEKKVSSLTAEIQARSETIELLERSLAEKQNHISELEAALRIAQQSMLDLAWDTVQHYRYQIWAGISRNLTDPKFEQLRRLLELIYSFPALTRQFTEIRIIKPGRHCVQVVIRSSRSCIGNTALFYHNTLNAIVLKYRLGLKQINDFFARFIEEAQNIIDQKLLWPIKNVFEDINETLNAAPSEARILARNKIVRPAWQTAGELAIKLHKLQIETQSLIATIRRSLQPLLRRWFDIVTGKIKEFRDSHSFGSSDRGMTGTYA